jgi:D-alanine-D-alanine ligase
MKGYTRVDIRIDSNGQPSVLEINPNPCLSPDAGFIAAANEAGMNYDDIITRIINDL